MNHPFFKRMEISISDTHRQLSAIISPCKSVRHYFSERCFFSSEKNLGRRMLEANKKQVSLKIRTDSVNQILKNKEKVTKSYNINILTRITDRKILCVYLCLIFMISQFKHGQTWKNWPSPLGLSLYSTFNDPLKHNNCCMNTC